MNKLQKLFGFDPKQTTIRTEVLAGITTFLTMSYILAVNPAMFSQLDGMPGGAVFTATALAAIVGTLAMAFIGKLPFGLAPGMGLNAFFVFSVCMGMGYSWQFALTAIFIEGILFIIMTITNIREAIVNAIPRSLRNAIGAGIGLFIAFIGMQNAGIIVNSDATLVALGEITKGSALLAIIGLVITGVLYVCLIISAKRSAPASLAARALSCRRFRVTVSYLSRSTAVALSMSSRQVKPCCWAPATLLL